MIRLQEGDSRAFDEIVREWQGPLTGFFIRNTRDEQLSEDLLQETMLRLYRRAWDYLPTGCFRGWLFRVARNLLIDHARRASHDALVRRVSPRAGRNDLELDPLKLIEADVIPPEVVAHQNELSALVSELLNQLPDEQRQTFLLHHFDSLTLSEVADVMETTLPTAKSRLRLAREKLRYLLTCRGFAEEMISENN